ncbi:MAG TPA: DUF5666 domain-containing protein [Mycobacteriales bacterium]|jgi:hypothetical protein|nr:DUF5666 domain-containing protein [Mycobacteriales bacterium]
MVAVSSRARFGAWIAAGVLGGAAISGIVVSQLGTATAAPSPSPRASAQPGPPMPFGGRLGLGLGGHVLHSEATVEAPDGTTKVVVSQSGDITDISGSTVTVKSTDGYEATYTVDKNTRISLNGNDGAMSSLKNGDTVQVEGTKTGSAAHADSVMDGVPTMFRFMPRDHQWRAPRAARPGTRPSESSLRG